MKNIVSVITALLLCCALYAGDLSLTYKQGRAIITNVEKGERVSLDEVSDGRYKYALVPCKPGDSFMADAHGGDIYLAWAFLDGDFRLLDKGGRQQHVCRVVTAPEGAAYLVINDKGSYFSFPCHKSFTKKPRREFCLENELAEAFLANTEYDNTDYTYSRIFDFMPPEGSGIRYDQPLGAELELPRVKGASDYTIEAADNPNFINKYTFPVGEYKPSYTIYNLIPGRIYSYRITARVGEAVLALEAGTFKTTGTRRMIKADSISNVRDFGGQKTCDGRTIRYGLLFRGCEMDRENIISPEDIKLLREFLGINADLDYRYDQELFLTDDDPENDIKTSPLGPDVVYSHMPIGGIKKLEDGGADWYVPVFRQLLDNLRHGRITYTHCIAGADRTGIISMMYEGLLGVSEADISKDIELTSFSRWGWRNRDATYFKLAQDVAKSMEGKTYREKWENLMKRYGITQEEIEEFRNYMLN